MAPALTKVHKDGHGIHFSSHPASVRMDSAIRSTELESQMKSPDGGDLRKIWLSLFPLPPQHSCFPARRQECPSRIPANPELSPYPQAFASQAVLPNSPTFSLSLLSLSKGLRESQQVASVFPGGADMFSVPEHNIQDVCLLRGHSTAPECVPDGGDVHHHHLTLSIAPLLNSHEESKCHGDAPVFAPPPTTWTQEKAAGTGCRPQPPASSFSSCSGRLNEPTSRFVLQVAMSKRLSRQAELQSRAQRLQRRLQAVLGDLALQHCNQQLKGLKKQCGGSKSPPQAGPKDPYSQLDSSSSAELREFCHSSQVVLRSLQEALDSEATASSSSDEEEEEQIHSKAMMSHVSGSCESRWLQERAELGSRWSWLQLRVAELDGRIQQLTELHKHIRSIKGRVVLAESQPLTDTQIQQTLLREMAGLSCTVLDADSEPYSPMHLLQNIEKQSAELSQIVNSLIPPLSFLPLSKPAHRCKGKTTITSGRRQDIAFVPRNSKRRRQTTRRIYKAYLSYMCARTRPLVTYHKPRLFAVSAYSSGSPQDSGSSTPTLFSSACSPCSSCDPVVLCCDPNCSSSRTLSSRTLGSTPNRVLCSVDTPLFQLAREEWLQRPLAINVQPYSPVYHSGRTATPWHNSHKLHKHHLSRLHSRVMGLSAIGAVQSAIKSQHRRANQRKRKRRHFHRLIDEEEGKCCDTEDSSDEVLEQRCTKATSKQTSQGFLHKRQEVSMYNINNIVIPASSAKVEKRHYKNIVTPSWCVIETSLLKDTEADVVEEEDLADEVFAQRHLALEQREKLHWAPWGRRKCCRRPKRSGSRLSGSGGGMCTSGEENSVEWSSVQLDTDEQQSSEEWLPQMPWDRRTFPLDEDDEESWLFGNTDKAPPGWSECGSVSATSKKSKSHLPPAQPASAALPSGGQSRNS